MNQKEYSDIKRNHLIFERINILNGVLKNGNEAAREKANAEVIKLMDKIAVDAR